MVENLFEMTDFLDNVLLGLIGSILILVSVINAHDLLEVLILLHVLGVFDLANLIDLLDSSQVLDLLLGIRKQQLDLIPGIHKEVLVDLLISFFSLVLIVID